MKKIDKLSTAAFLCGLPFKGTNTKVVITDNDWVTLVLYNTTIAKRRKNTSVVYMQHGGYPTNTTLSRLNALLCSAKLTRKKDDVYFSGRTKDETILTKWDGKWMDVSEFVYTPSIERK